MGAGHRKVSGRTIFLMVMVAIYGLVWGADPKIASAALKEFFAMAGKVLPILGLVFILLFILNIFLTPPRVRTFFGTGSGVRGWVLAIIGSILITGPPYVLYPMLGECKRHGMKDSLLAVILYNRNVKIPFLPPMVYYFGLPYTVVLSSYILLFSVLNGMIIGYFLRERVPK